jgi:hypothetical protein
MLTRSLCGSIISLRSTAARHAARISLRRRRGSTAALRDIHSPLTTIADAALVLFVIAAQAA